MINLLDLRKELSDSFGPADYSTSITHGGLVSESEASIIWSKGDTSIYIMLKGDVLDINLVRQEFYNDSVHLPLDCTFSDILGWISYTILNHQNAEELG